MPNTDASKDQLHDQQYVAKYASPPLRYSLPVAGTVPSPQLPNMPSISNWGSTPWADAGSSWYLPRVPYVANPTYLHTLDLWVPKAANGSEPQPETGKIPPHSGPWIIYIHGGAWRDPLVDSSSFESTALTLLSTKGDTPIAGVASINYPLSSHPLHPTNPSPPTDPSEPIDIARMAKHPDHIIAVISALDYLQTTLGVAHDYILSGHSCGATLSFQVAMDTERWTTTGCDAKAVPTIKKPSTLVGLNGLYDLPYFLNQPDESHAALVPVYDAFTRGAFGNDEEVWKKVCPTDVEDWSTEWPEGKTVYVVQSKEDGLVPYSQTELMKKRLAETSTVEVKELEAGGDHNDLWGKGTRLAEILLEIVRSI